MEIRIRPDPIPKKYGDPRTGTLFVNGTETRFCGDRSCVGGCGLPQLWTAKDPSLAHLGDAQEGHQWSRYTYYVTVRLGVSPVLEILGPNRLSPNREHPHEVVSVDVRDALNKRTWW